jgi:hypothetical protein
MGVLHNPWAVAWYTVTCTTMLFIQLNVFKKDLKYGFDVSIPWFLYAMIWVFCPILNLLALLMWTYTTVVQQQEN